MKTKSDILRLIDEEDVEFIRLQFADVFGNLKNVAVTLNQMDLVFDNLYSVDESALFDGKVLMEEEVFLKPDLDSFVLLPWRPQHRKVGKLICDLCDEDGNLLELSPRTILKNVITKAEAEGFTFMVNPECEFFLFHTDEQGRPTTLSHEEAGYLDAGPVDLGENARRDIVLTLEDMGFEVERSHHEVAPAQHEIDFSQGESMDTADAVMTFKLAVRSIAKRFGLHATFMPKPKTGVPGSGMHLNFAMYKDGKNLFGDKDGQISDEAKQFIAGIMAHAEGMCAITNPIVNSYKRLLSGHDAPYFVNWSMKGESALIKYRKRLGERTVEVRFPDPAANPYLAIAVCITAGMDGIHRQLDPGKPEARSKRHLPGNLKGAIKLLERDQLICDMLGSDFVKAYSRVKTAEWDEYMRQVSDWEIDRYLGKM